MQKKLEDGSIRVKTFNVDVEIRFRDASFVVPVEVIAENKDEAEVEAEDIVSMNISTCALSVEEEDDE